MSERKYKILKLNEDDILKMDIVRKRYLISSHIDVVRYLLTVEIEKIAKELDLTEGDKDKDNKLGLAFINPEKVREVMPAIR